MVPKAKGSGRVAQVTETGAVKKNWRGRISVALVYPNTYYVGMSNLGFQTVYALMNGFDDVVCERAFLPKSNGKRSGALRSLESGRRLADFDIIAFSISFENDYLHLLSILEKAGLPLLSSERCPPNPLIVAGGATSLLNPEPISSFIDCFLIGDAEALLPSFFQCFRQTSNRKDLLRSLAKTVTGVYVPSLYDASYGSDGTMEGLFPSEQDIPERVRRVMVTDLQGHDASTAVVTSNTTFSNTCLIEGARGCPHGCRFCAAGYVYRPPRYKDGEQLERLVEKAGLKARSIGLVAAAVADIPSLESFCKKAVACDLTLSFSSLRADMLTPSLLETLKKTGTKTVTIAPDAGSERLRRVINKGMNENDVLAAVDLLVGAGILNIKLYFMVGLPTETMSDVDDIVALCKRIKHRFLKASRAQARIGEIVVSISSFVPKPFTPFQWVPLEEVKNLKKKIKHIKEGLKRVPNVKVHADVPRWAYVQALLSRGDRRVGPLLTAVHANDGNWSKSLKETIINTDFFVYRSRSVQEVLPWDFIDHGIKKDFLISEFEKALAEKTTPPCRLGKCTVCGVCE